MRILNFKDFNLNERVGVSKPSIQFIEPIQNLALNEFEKFFLSGENSYEEIIKLSYRKIRPHISDWSSYVDFPCVGFEIVLNFKRFTTTRFVNKYDNTRPIRIGGSASGFGHKNWKNYSKIVDPIKKLSDIGLIIQIGIEIDIDKVNFDLENPLHKEELIDGVGSTIFHELNHSYEHYRRTIKGTKRGQYRKPIYDRSFNTSLTYAENNIWKFPKPIWKLWSDSFLHYIYMSESFELNANVQEMFYYLRKYPNKELNSFRIYQKADSMEKFDPDKFYQELLSEISKHNWKDLGNFTLHGIRDAEKIADKLKDMWVSVYRKEIAEQKAKPVISLSTLERMSCLQFIKFWGRQFNRNGSYLKRKIQKLKTTLQNEEIF